MKLDRLAWSYCWCRICNLKSTSFLYLFDSCLSHIMQCSKKIQNQMINWSDIIVKSNLHYLPKFNNVNFLFRVYWKQHQKYTKTPPSWSTTYKTTLWSGLTKSQVTKPLKIPFLPILPLKTKTVMCVLLP